MIDAKGSLGKGTDALDPDEHFDVIALMRLRVVCVCVVGEGVEVTLH